MYEKFNVRLSHPVVMSFWSFAMLLAGIVVGALWHPSRVQALVVAVVAAVITLLHELIVGFAWCSFSSWWIDRRMQESNCQRER
jgi:hypothetical protein